MRSSLVGISNSYFLHDENQEMKSNYEYLVDAGVMDITSAPPTCRESSERDELRTRDDAQNRTNAFSDGSLTLREGAPKG